MTFLVVLFPTKSSKYIEHNLNPTYQNKTCSFVAHKTWRRVTRRGYGGSLITIIIVVCLKHPDLTAHFFYSLSRHISCATLKSIFFFPSSSPSLHWAQRNFSFVPILIRLRAHSHRVHESKNNNLLKRSRQNAAFPWVSRDTSLKTHWKY